MTELTSLQGISTIERIGEPVERSVVGDRPQPLFELGSRKGIYPGARDAVTSVSAPNKVQAADPRWGYKSAFNSDELRKRQTELDTYSVELAMIFDGLLTIVSRIMKRPVPDNELQFVINFGSPIQGNKQSFSVLITKPLEIRLQITRTLIDGKLQWSAEIIATENTQLTTPKGMLDLKKASGELEIDRIEATGGTSDELRDLPSMSSDKKRRKVRV